jgi:hypothetical protein
LYLALLFEFQDRQCATSSFRIRANTRPRRDSFRCGRLWRHDLVAGFAQPILIATQACDDPAYVGNVTAAQPEHVGTASILLCHRALREGGAAANDCRYEQDGAD